MCSWCSSSVNTRAAKTWGVRCESQRKRERKNQNKYQEGYQKKKKKKKEIKKSKKDYKYNKQAIFHVRLSCLE
jgi:hypothetical protein